ncbi:hypothetical protein Hypma_000675 [Hypsizygus marmoreus]|uniref:Uncharacterized protein n=1 Tax=Hypsizygus marmoreus TaxID=39966 RepID=A0A369JDL4_HYPMA|nr:hypothetical protein Hypma_000675 [Hypsizygus marmoreus]
MGRTSGKSSKKTRTSRPSKSRATAGNNPTSRRIRTGRSASPMYRQTSSSSPAPQTPSSNSSDPSQLTHQSLPSPTHRRSDTLLSDNEEDAGETPADDDLNPDDYHTNKGRIVARYRFMWKSFIPMMEEGISCTAEDDPESFPDHRQQLYDNYNDLVAFVPLLPDHLREAGPQGLMAMAKALDSGRSKARSTDIHSLKQNIHRWKKFQPSFDAMNCPSLGIQTALRDGTKKVKASDLPVFLWKDEYVNTRDFFDGFMRGEIVQKAFKHIFISPSTARDMQDGDGSRRRGNAAIHGLRNVTIHSLSYVSTLARFVLSDQQTFAAGDKTTPNRFPFRSFYNNLISVMRAMDEEDLEDLLIWTIFGGTSNSDDEVSDGDEDGTSILRQMKEQAARAKQAKQRSQSTAA